MEPQKTKEQIKVLLAETILALCRNTLYYHSEISVEGLIGITLDKEDVFLVSVNQSLQNKTVADQGFLAKGLNRKRTKIGHSTGDGVEKRNGHKPLKRRRKLNYPQKSSAKNDCTDSSSDAESEKGGGQEVVKGLNVKFGTENNDSDRSRAIHSSHDNSEDGKRLSSLSPHESCNDPNRLLHPKTSIKEENISEESNSSELIVVKQEREDMQELSSEETFDHFPILSSAAATSVVDGTIASTDCKNSLMPHYSDFMKSVYPFTRDIYDGMNSSNNIHNVNNANGGTSELSQDGSTTNTQENGGQLSISPLESPRRRYHCNLCGTSANSQASLNTHLRVHTGEKPYSCPVCAKSFSRKENMKRHIIALHMEMPTMSENNFNDVDQSHMVQ